MRELVLKSVRIGFLIGAMFFAIAPLGLGISLIEALRPVLIPSVVFMQVLGINTINTGFVLFAILLNGLIYSAIVLGILVIKSRVTR